MKNRIQILDCTLRDGGLGLEDAAKNGLEWKRFDNDSASRVANLLSAASIDIVELGSIEISEEDKTGFCIYQSIEKISETMPRKSSEKQMFAALYRGPDTPLELIPDWNESLCEAVRVILRYSELDKSLDFCKGLSEKGYKVFVQPMLTMRYTEDEINKIINAANEMKAYALYFVDSYGYMTEEDVERIFIKYDKELLPTIRIGFHGHNNMNLALPNAISFINFQTDRKVIVDACIMGMGQGAGNLQTELISYYLLQHGLCNIVFDNILRTCEIIENFSAQNRWGYSVARFLPAMHKAAYKYASLYRDRYNLSYVEINNIFMNMPTEYKQRYTLENAIKMLKLFEEEREASEK